jgi:hypothetical protein
MSRSAANLSPSSLAIFGAAILIIALLIGAVRALLLWLLADM